MRDAASQTAESIKSGDFGRGVCKSIQKSTRNARDFVQELKDFVDLEDIRNSLRRLSSRQPSDCDEHRQQKIIHTALDPRTGTSIISLKSPTEEDYSDVTKDYDNITDILPNIPRYKHNTDMELVAP